MRESGKTPEDKIRKWLKDVGRGKFRATEAQIEQKRELLERLERVRETGDLCPYSETHCEDWIFGNGCMDHGCQFYQDYRDQDKEDRNRDDAS